MSAALAAPLPALIWDHAPNPREVDELALQFLALEAKVDEAYRVATMLDEPLEIMRERIVLVVEEWGQAHAAKSKLLVGAGAELVATFGATRTIDNAAVEAFRVALKVAGRTRMLSKLFEECVSYRLVDGATAIIRGQQMSDSLKALFARCFVERPRSPVLKVRLR